MENKFIKIFNDLKYQLSLQSRFSYIDEYTNFLKNNKLITNVSQVLECIRICDLILEDESRNELIAEYREIEKIKLQLKLCLKFLNQNQIYEETIAIEIENFFILNKEQILILNDSEIENWFRSNQEKVADHKITFDDVLEIIKIFRKEIIKQNDKNLSKIFENELTKLLIFTKMI